MGMSHFELEKITPRSLFNKLIGHRSRDRQEWERTRLMCFFAFSPINPDDPDNKTLMPVQEFMPLPWDEDGESSWEKIKRDAMNQKQKSAELWRKIDNN